MTTIGFIGSGSIGGTVAKLAVQAGYDVVLSNSREPSTLAGVVAELGPHARAATPAEAAEAGALVVVSVPFHAHVKLPVEQLAGKVVLNTNNYYPQRDGTVDELEGGTLTSAELEQERLAGARIVKVFNNIFFKHLGNLALPGEAEGRTALPIAGDDEEAKAAAAEFLDAIGYDAVDVGPLSESWRFEPGQPAYGPPYGSFDDPAGTPAGADKVRAALAEAKR